MHGFIKGNTYYKKESEIEKLRIGGNSWTILLSELSGKQIENIVYITNQHAYSISYINALKKGFIRLLGGEIKLIVPIRAWEIK